MPDKRKRPNVAPVSKRSRKELSPSESSGSGSGSEDGMDGGNDRYLESDSEEDEFEGLATYEVDDWDENGGGRAGGSGSGSEGEDDDGSEEDNGDEAVSPAISTISQSGLSAGRVTTRRPAVV